jgi:uncharacterized protein (TIGR02265 family)
MATTSVSGRVKGGGLQSRLEFVRDHHGEAGVERVMKRLSAADQEALQQILTGGWYPFELNDRLDRAVAAEMGMGDKVFLLMGAKSATHNLGKAHKVFITDKDPHGLLKRTAQIYQAYYDTGRRTYERAGDTKAVLTTWDSATYSAADCLTIVGWHTNAIEMCGGKDVKVIETKCRARGAAVCEYVCEWS